MTIAGLTPEELYDRIHRIDAEAEALAACFAQFAVTAEATTEAFLRMGDAMREAIREQVAMLRPSERIAYWFLVRVCRRYPDDTLSLLETLRDHSPEPMER